MFIEVKVPSLTTVIHDSSPAVAISQKSVEKKFLLSGNHVQVY
jgi:hypothetical protein